MAASAPASPEASFSYTMKDRRGDLFTVRGESWDEFHGNLLNVLDIETIDKVIGEINDRASAEAPAPASTPSGGGGNSGGNGDWSDNPPVCQHGTMRAQSYTAKSGPKKDQQQYTFFCPQPREAPQSEKCTPIDGITRKPWGSK